jgi:hypothetical protein
MQTDFSTLPNVRAAIAAMANGVDIFLGPDLDTLTGLTFRGFNNLPHFNNAGAQSAGVLWSQRLNQIF